ncbi:hypothetical protein ES708_34044 [subsurface metagenome]
MKFAEHAEAWFKYKEEFQQIREVQEIPEQAKNLFSESDAVVRFFNGASDHLYEMEIPERWQGTAIESKVTELGHLARTIGHGSTGQEWSEKDVIKAYDLCRAIALLIDKELGLSPDIGER